MEEYRCWRRPIFPCSHPQSIFGVDELNFRVRNGNGWTLITMNTNLHTFSVLPENVFPILFYALFVLGDPYGIRTHVAGVRGRSLRPLDQRAIYLNPIQDRY